MSTAHQSSPHEAGRLDLYLIHALGPHISRARVQQHIRDGLVTIDGAVTKKPSTTVLPGQQVRHITPDIEIITADDIQPLEIIHEDEAVLVIHKAVGVVVHPTEHRRSGTLVNTLLSRYPSIQEAVLEPGNPISEARPGIVHRLDRETSGLMVVAKTRDALVSLQEQFASRSVEKKYRTVLFGTLSEPRDVSAGIRRRGSESKNRMVASHKGEGREAHTLFTPLESISPYTPWQKESATLCEVTLFTGRTHQIRVHAKFIGHPVLGDPLYFNKPSMKLSNALALKHQVLQASRLSFTHPVSGERLLFELPQLCLSEYLRLQAQNEA